MSRDTVDLYNPKVIRSTMGSIYRVPFYYADDFAAAVHQVQQAGVSVYAAHLRGKNSYACQDYTKGTAFLIGNEGNGPAGRDCRACGLLHPDSDGGQSGVVKCSGGVFDSDV